MTHYTQLGICTQQAAMFNGEASPAESPLTFPRTCSLWLTAAISLYWDSSNSVLPSGPAHSSLHLILQELGSNVSSNLNFLCQWPPQKQVAFSRVHFVRFVYWNCFSWARGERVGALILGGWENMLLILKKTKIVPSFHNLSSRMFF